MSTTQQVAMAMAAGWNQLSTGGKVGVSVACAVVLTTVIVVSSLAGTGHLTPVATISGQPASSITAPYLDYVDPALLTAGGLPTNLCDTFCNQHTDIVRVGGDLGWTGAIATSVLPDKDNACTCVPSSTYAFGTLGLSTNTVVQAAVDKKIVPQLQLTASPGGAAGLSCDAICNWARPVAVDSLNSPLIGSVAAKNWPVTKLMSPENLAAAGYTGAEPGFSGVGCVCIGVNDISVAPYAPNAGVTGSATAKAGQTCEQACQTIRIPPNSFPNATGRGMWTHVGSNTPGPNGACSCIVYPLPPTAAKQYPAGISLTL